MTSRSWPRMIFRRYPHPPGGDSEAFAKHRGVSRCPPLGRRRRRPLRSQLSRVQYIERYFTIRGCEGSPVADAPLALEGAGSQYPNFAVTMSRPVVDELWVLAESLEDAEVLLDDRTVEVLAFLAD